MYFRLLKLPFKHYYFRIAHDIHFQVFSNFLNSNFWFLSLQCSKSAIKPMPLFFGFVLFCCHALCQKSAYSPRVCGAHLKVFPFSLESWLSPQGFGIWNSQVLAALVSFCSVQIVLSSIFILIQFLILWWPPTI